MACNGFVLWNARSIVKKLPDINLFLHMYQPLAMCLTETWLTSSIQPTFPNYPLVRKDRPNGTGGGLIFLIHYSMTFAGVQLIPFRGGLLETLVIKVSSPVGQLHLFLCYDPCRDIPVQELEHFAHQLGPLSLIIGDFNAHHDFWEPSIPRFARNKAGKALYSFLMSSGDFSLLTPPGLLTRYDPYNARSSTLD